MLTKGLDVSSHQGAINWMTVKRNGFEFAFIKATEGAGYIDPKVAVNANAAQAAGLKIGYYHFATLRQFDPLVGKTPETTDEIVKDAVSEANYFFKVTGRLPVAEFPMILDFENDVVNRHTLPNPFDKTQNTLWVETFVRTLHRAGCHAVLYCNRQYFENHLNNTPLLGKIPLWYALYSNTLTPPASPKSWQPWDIWQFTAKGIVPGIRGQVDLNLMKDTFFNQY
jgi:lysozyme